MKWDFHYNLYFKGTLLVKNIWLRIIFKIVKDIAYDMSFT